MQFETLLFHTQFRDLACNALKTAGASKPAGLKKVVLAHVIPRGDVAFVSYGGVLKEDMERYKETACIKCADWIQTIPMCWVPGVSSTWSRRPSGGLKTKAKQVP